jgi:hypothetical protein
MAFTDYLRVASKQTGYQSMAIVAISALILGIVFSSYIAEATGALSKCHGTQPSGYGWAAFGATVLFVGSAVAGASAYFTYTAP